MAEQSTPSLDDVRHQYSSGVGALEADFDRWLAEHDAALIESLAESLNDEDESAVNIALGGRGYVDYWLREKARERREGVA